MNQTLRFDMETSIKIVGLAMLVGMVLLIGTMLIFTGVVHAHDTENQHDHTGYVVVSDSGEIINYASNGTQLWSIQPVTNAGVSLHSVKYNEHTNNYIAYAETDEETKLYHINQSGNLVDETLINKTYNHSSNDFIVGHNNDIWFTESKSENGTEYRTVKAYNISSDTIEYQNNTSADFNYMPVPAKDKDSISIAYRLETENKFVLIEDDYTVSKTDTVDFNGYLGGYANKTWVLTDSSIDRTSTYDLNSGEMVNYSHGGNIMSVFNYNDNLHLISVDNTGTDLYAIDNGFNKVGDIDGNSTSEPYYTTVYNNTTYIWYQYLTDGGDQKATWSTYDGTDITATSTDLTNLKVFHDIYAFDETAFNNTDCIDCTDSTDSTDNTTETDGDGGGLTGDNQVTVWINSFWDYIGSMSDFKKLLLSGFMGLLVMLYAKSKQN